MTTAYGIYSGGLDSTLAAKTLADQGIEVRLITFVTPFFNETKALSSSKLIGLDIRPVDITEPHLVMVQNPKHGYGRFMNPCIDCHAMMFNRAGKIMEAEGGDFLFSGEVLGQRPMSQNQKALGIVEAESGYQGKIIRPLSAKKLAITPMEETGLIDRVKLHDISGRSRKPQMKLAASLGISDYPTPAGGCLLTDPVFSRRLKELKNIQGELKEAGVRILKTGRHFRLPGKAKLVVGRNEKENKTISELKQNGDHILYVGNSIPGPTALLIGGVSGDIELAAEITLSYSDASGSESFPINIENGSEKETTMVRLKEKSSFSHMMIN